VKYIIAIFFYSFLFILFVGYVKQGVDMAFLAPL